MVADAGCAPLLRAAADKFQSAAALALHNWGSVHVSCGRKRLDAALTAAALRVKGEHGASGIPVAAMEAAIEGVTADGLEALDAQLVLAAARWALAAEVKPDFLDPGIAWGQQLFERAKVLALRAKAAPPRAAATEVDAAFAAAVAKFEALQALVAAPPAAEPEGEDARLQQHNLLILAGNVLFEHSQVSFLRGDDSAVWRPLAADAVRRFADAQCAAGDIERALRGHPSGAFPDGQKKSAWLYSLRAGMLQFDCAVKPIFLELCVVLSMR